jgi:hypothetical protein
MAQSTSYVYAPANGYSYQYATTPQSFDPIWREDVNGGAQYMAIHPQRIVADAGKFTPYDNYHTRWFYGAAELHGIDAAHTVRGWSADLWNVGDSAHAWHEWSNEPVFRVSENVVVGLIYYDLVPVPELSAGLLLTVGVICALFALISGKIWEKIFPKR